MTIVLPFVLALAVTMSLLPLLVRYAGHLRLLDLPSQRKQHAQPIPRVGGIAMAVGVLAAVSSSGFALDNSDGTFLIGAVVIFVSGLLDDRFDLDYRAKFAGQVIACAIPLVAGGLWVHSLEIPDYVALPRILAIALTMFYFIGVTNAVNLSDGLDGLAGGTTFLCLCALGWLAYMSGATVAFGLCLAFAGAVLGFLRFNTHPAIVFMGDAGSQLLGYAIGGLGLLATQHATTIFCATLPILLLGVPILDTLQVMTRRVATGHSPFRADRGHLHHRLLALGFEHHEAVMAIYTLQAAMLIVAYLVRFENDLVVVGTFIGFATVCLVSLSIAERTGWRVRVITLDRARSGPVTRVFIAAYDSGALLRTSVWVVALGISAYACLILLQAGVVGGSFSSLTWAEAGAMAAVLVVKRNGPLGVVDRALLYSIVAAFVLADVSVPPELRDIPHLDWGIVLLVALATVVALRSSAGRRFEVTPLDVLVLFITLVVPNLPGLDVLPGVMSLAIAKLVVLFYALEVVVTIPQSRPAWVRFAGASAAALLAWQFSGGR